MPAITGLKQAFTDVKISTVAIVDDGYDIPDNSILERNPDLYEKFRFLTREMLRDVHLKATVDTSLIELIENLPELSALEDNDYDDLTPNLWSFYISNQAKLGEMSAQTLVVYRSLDEIFGDFYAKSKEKLAQLKYIEDIIQEASGNAPHKFKSDARGEDLVGFDLIFLDFYLDDAIPANAKKFSELEQSALEAARKKSIDLAIQTVEARGEGQPVPLFVLISTIAKLESAPDFRDEAGVLASKFRFVSKSQFSEDKIKSVIVITELLRQRNNGDSLDLFIEKWSDSIDKAKKQLLMSIRRLDLSDYHFIDNYRLKAEKISIGSYVTNMYNSLLGSLVEEEVLKTKTLDLFSQIKLDDPAPSHLGPSDEVTDIYSRITTSTVHTLGALEALNVWAGDLFVRRNLLEPKKSKVEHKVVGDPQKLGEELSAAVNLAEAEGNKSSGPEIPEVDSKQLDLRPDILAVITPSCDLVPGRVKVNSVTLIGGTLAPLGTVKKPSSHLLVMDSRKYQIDWNGKWPVTYNHAYFKGVGIEGTDYVKIGRLRSLYHLELQNFLTGEMSGVGVPVAPPISFGISLKVLAKPVKGDFVEVLHISPEMGKAWAMYTARNSEGRTFIFDERFRWHLREEIISKSSSAKRLNADCLSLTDDITFLNALRKPFEIKGSPTSLPGFKDRIVLKRVTDFNARDKGGEGTCCLLFLFLDGPPID